MQLTEAIIEFLKYLALQKRYSPNTIIAYENDLIIFKDYLSLQYEIENVQTIKASFIRSWLVTLREGNIQARSVNRKISSLQSFFKYALKKDWITVTPMTVISNMKVAKKIPEYISDQDLKTLFSYVEFPDSWEGARDRLILSILYYTGMRRAELLSLKFSDIDVYQKQVKILGKGNKERLVPLLPNLIIEILSFKNLIAAEPQDFIIADNKKQTLNPRKLYSIVKKYLTLISTSAYKGPHALRHSFATHLAYNGADLNAIKELLGHSSLAATQVYTHHSLDKLKNVHKQAHPRS